MFKILLIVSVIFLSVIGLSDLLHRLWFVLIRPNKSKNYLITFLKDECAVEQVSAVLEEMRWQGKMLSCRLVGIDMGLSSDLSNILKELEKNTDDFLFVPADIFPQKMLEFNE